jgi:hypothetical protein
MTHPKRLKFKASTKVHRKPAFAMTYINQQVSEVQSALNAAPEEIKMNQGLL